jgi:hypothetical protein
MKNATVGIGRKGPTMESPVIVIDIPIATPAEEATRILSQPVTRGYYVKGVTAGEPMRVLYAQYAATEDKCADELRAMELVVTHRAETATRIVGILCEHGIYRGTTWVNKTRDELT